jgi:hypothetical protein
VRLDGVCYGLILTYMIMIPIYLRLAAFSLQYYVVKHDIDPKALEAFLNELPAPFRAFFTDKTRFNLYSGDYRINNLELIYGVPSGQSQLNRVMGLFMSGFMLVAMTISFTRETERLLIISYALMMILHLCTILWAWRFGTKLLTRNKIEPPKGA